MKPVANSAKTKDGDRSVRLLSIISSVYLPLALLLGNAGFLLFATLLLSLLNIAVSFRHLFQKGSISLNIVTLNVLQLGLFCVLHYQIYRILGPAHYVFPETPKWYNWPEFVFVHLFKAVDIADLIEAYGLEISSVKHGSALSGTVTVCMHIVIDIFLYGAIRNVFRNNSMSIPGINDGLACRLKSVRFWALLAVLASFLFCLMADLMNTSSVGHGNLINGYLWIIENILITLDFGDMFQTFDWHLHKMGEVTGLATVTVAFRVLVGSYTISLVSVLSFYISGGFGNTVEKLGEIVSSCNHTPYEREIAAKRLAKFGPAGAVAAPDLVAASEVSDMALREAANNALDEIGSKAIPHLIRELIYGEEHARGILSDSLERIDPDWSKTEEARSTIPEILGAMTDADEFVRKSGRMAMETIDPQWQTGETAQALFCDLAGMLDAPNPVTRYHALKILSGITPVRPNAVYRIARALADTDRDVRLCAAGSLERINPNWRQNRYALNAIPHFSKVLTGNADPLARCFAAKALGKFGTNAWEALPFLEKAMNDPEEKVRAFVSKALKKIRRPGKRRI